MKGEIENPHGGGIYGHKYYGMPREWVVFTSDASKYHNEMVNNRMINSMLEDGLLTQEEHAKCKQLANELFGIIDTSLQTILEKGDEINRSAGYEL